MDDICEWLPNSAETKGDIGEAITSSTLSNECNMLTVRNVYLPYKNGYTQIDIIAISREGVYVVENKNYSGLIIGNRERRYWKVHYGKNTTQKLFNPVIQNHIHCKCVSDLLKTDNQQMSIPIYTLVIFNDKATLKVADADSVTYTLSAFTKKYKEYEFNNILSKKEVYELYKFFRKYSDSSNEMRELHISLLKKRKVV